MGLVVVTGATMKCPHGGQLQLKSGDSRLQVGQASVVVSGMEAGLAFAPGAPGVLAPCTKTLPNGAPSPCAGTQSALPSGLAQKLTVGGKPALLKDASGMVTNPASPGATWSFADAGQTQLESA